MAGRFIAVVRPSGVGKDSVIAGLCATCTGLHRVRRVVTRAADPTEDHDTLDAPAFAAAALRGAFVLHWQAHGLCYGIPATVLADLAQGRDLIANLSRQVLAQAAVCLPRLDVLVLSAAPATLAARLAGRGREAPGDIARRIARDATLPPGLTIHRISNDGPLPGTIAAARTALYPERA